MQRHLNPESEVKMNIPTPDPSEDERAVGFMTISSQMQEQFMGRLGTATNADKAVIAEKIVEYGSFIAKDRSCAPGEIIWLRAKEFSTEHNITVLAAIRVLGEMADKMGDWHGTYAALIIRAMTLLSHAKTIAQSEEVKTRAFVQSYALGLLVDNVMKDAPANSAD